MLINHLYIIQVPPPPFFFFNWRVIALQYCAGFCHTSAWFSHRYTWFSPLSPEGTSPTPSHPARLSQSTVLSSRCYTANSHLSILHMVMYMFPYYSLNSSNSPLLPLCLQFCSLSLCLHCCPADRFERLLLSRERCWDSWPLEERNSIWGQWGGLTAQSSCVIKFY